MGDYEWKLGIKYDPNQPRVPRGDPQGGQWTGIRSVPPEEFVQARDKYVPEKYKAFVTPYSAAEYKEMGAQTFMVKGRAGAAVKPDGDIISVFAEEDSGLGGRAVQEAIRRGGWKLDCFDSVKGRGLPTYYHKFGFREYDRWKWNDEYAPEGWDYEEFDRPDVVLMKLEGR